MYEELLWAQPSQSQQGALDLDPGTVGILRRSIEVAPNGLGPCSARLVQQVNQLLPHGFQVSVELLKELPWIEYHRSPL